MSHPISSLRRALTATLAVSLLGGCASIQNAVDSIKTPPEPAVEPTPEATPQKAPAPPAAKPPVAPAPKPAVRSRPAEPLPVKPAPAPAQDVPPAPQAMPGPAWLKQCQSAQLAGGIVRCDADLLLAKPSPTVQVFTRDPQRVVDGQIRLRAGLPRIYRFFVVP